ncbi:MAG: hypothetical protein OEY59_12490 [Deltaproteobacteria bacterium]|nr:hypothetical protein [Deltaproteobacteria bacterium]
MNLEELPFWMGGPFWAALRNIAVTIWDKIELAINNVIKSARIEHAGAETLKIKWLDLPIKPTVPESIKKDFIKYYDQFMDNGGKLDGVMLTQTIFGLTEFYLETSKELTNLPVPHHYLRYWVDAGTGQLSEIRAFLRIAGPGRSVFHTDIFEIEPALGYGITPYGQNYGN